MLSLLAAILGIGLLLFVHETGHFVACRLAGVRVLVFSLGFGPRLVGFVRKGTDFRISAIPLGGYVRPAGEDSARAPLPGEIGAASPGWRFFIYSGGILMNFLFALVMIPLLFRIGVPMAAPVAGVVASGTPAWHAGIELGDRVLAVDGAEVHGFQQFLSAVALAKAGDELELDLERPDGSGARVRLTPEYEPAYGLRLAGVGAPFEKEFPLELAAARGVEAALPVGARILAVDGVDVRTPFDAAVMREQALYWSGETLRLRVRASAGAEGGIAEQELLLQRQPPGPDDPPQVGVRRLENRVRGLRAGALRSLLRPEDQVLEANGAPVSRRGDVLSAAVRAGGLQRLAVQRDGARLDLVLDAPLSAQEVAAQLWLGPYDELVVEVTPGTPAAAAGLRTGDRVLRVNHTISDSFEDLAQAVAAAGDQPVSFLVARPGEDEPIELQVQPAPLPRWNFALAQRVLEEVVRRDNLFAALRIGVTEAQRMVREVFLMLTRLFTGDVDRRNLGGIITIGQLTHASAEQGLVPLLFFLAMLSLHLGVLNLLPIPALDGGHLLFILIEKIRGRPLSERTQGWINLAGFVAVMALLLFALSHDIQRLLGG